MGKNMTFTATGDSFITRTLPFQDKSFERIKSLLMQGDARFTNLETTVHSHEGYPAPFSGGTWAMSDPKVLETIKDFGFNLIGWANNHTMDYLYGGLEATERNLDANNFVHAGAGKSLAEASAPKYLESPSGRVAIISATSTYHESWIAGEQNRDEKGRPGVNPLRYSTEYVVEEAWLNQLKLIAEKVKINADADLQRKEGFLVDSESDGYLFGEYRFSKGTSFGKKTTPLKKDVNRMIQSITEAKQQANYIIVSIHAHEMKDENKDQPADFLVSFARQCIDAGAHAIIGHGPHVLRGIEIYKKRPIFYSLGNFIFQTETVKTQPFDFYEKYGLDRDSRVTDALNAMSSNYTRGLCVNPHVWESVIPKWGMKNGELTELTLYPIELGFELPVFQMGWPTPSNNMEILERIKNLSEPFGTAMEISDGVAKVNL